MTATHLLYAAQFHAPVPPGSAICWLCGASCLPLGADDPPEAPALDRSTAAVIRSTFNDAARARGGGVRGGDSDVCCHACAWYCDHKILRPGAKRAMGFFTKSLLVVRSHWREWERATMADDLLGWQRDGLPEDAVLALNYSKQKHVLPWARVQRAGSRALTVATDAGEVAVPGDLPDRLTTIAILWARQYPKTLIARAQPSPYVLARSPTAAEDQRLFRSLAPLVGSPVMDLCTYLVTEEWRDRHTGHPAPALGATDPAAATGGDAGLAAQSGGRPKLQEPLRAALVGDAGGAGEVVCDDECGSAALRQYALFPA